MAPFNAFLTITGIETLSVRMERHCANGLEVAKFLEAHPKVAWVSHAGLESSKYKGLAEKYLGGHGGTNSQTSAQLRLCSLDCHIDILGR
jgi:O-acetylhomoserine (thiol)-lyase